MKITPNQVWPLLKETFEEWKNDDASRISAALAYYSVFSLAPLLLIAISLAGVFLGEEAARGAVEQQLQGTLGEQPAETVNSMVESTKKEGSNILMTFVGVGVILFSASGLFAQLKKALNDIWNVETKPDAGIMDLVKARFLSLSMVLVIAFLLLLSLVLSTALGFFSDTINHVLPVHPVIWHLAAGVISFAMVTVLFAMLFKVLPDAHIEWRDVWIGAAITAGLFTVGKFLLGLYLGREAASSAHGAAGAVILILSWVFYTANILLFGAEFTQVFARFRGRKIEPDRTIAQKAA